jgi:MbtH protein
MCIVLVNDEGQYSLWPTFADVPAGWTAAYGPGKRKDCLEFVNAEWTDMRPKSLTRSQEDLSR